MHRFETLPSHILSSVAEEVTEKELPSQELQGFIHEMLEVARGEREEMGKKVMVGLAAPQLGVAKRIILVDVNVDSDRKNLGRLVVYINPEILSASEEREEGREGCFSLDQRLWGIVSRPMRIKIRALNPQGESISEELSGFTARIFQHEFDHLNGILFPDRIGKDGVLHWVEEQEYSLYRNQWNQWQKKCPWETWLAMKEGQG
jgi:peptide deformylase